MVVRDLLVRGLLVGLLAGVVAFGVAELLGEPQVNRAIVVETRIDQQLVRQPAPAIVSRAIQSSVGLATGVLVLAATFGGLFALAFAFAYGRIGRAGARVTAVLVAAAGFCAIYLVPFLKYPANPPSVGQPSTIDHRTELYFAMVLISVLTMIGAIVLGRQLNSRLGAWNAALLAGGAFLVVSAGVFLVLPGVNEVSAVLPATILWRLRLASLATHLTLWTAIGLLFGALTERSEGHRRRPSLDAFR